LSSTYIYISIKWSNFHVHFIDESSNYIFRTTYGKMNEWMKGSGGRDMRSGVPVTRSDGNWKQTITVCTYRIRPLVALSHLFKHHTIHVTYNYLMFRDDPCMVLIFRGLLVDV